MASGASAIALTQPFSSARGEVTEAGAATYCDPLFAGDYADPSIVRVGEDFYLTHTTYSYAPGLTVWHSRDLVHWTAIANALDKYHGEVWAPDFIEHKGRYYIYYPQDGALFVVHSDNPRGPWSEPVAR